jgi:hypothetical protein
MVVGLLETLNEAQRSLAPDPNEPQVHPPRYYMHYLNNNMLTCCWRGGKVVSYQASCNKFRSVPCNIQVSATTRKKMTQRAVSRLGAAYFDLENFASQFSDLEAETIGICEKISGAYNTYTFTFSSTGINFNRSNLKAPCANLNQRT